MNKIAGIAFVFALWLWLFGIGVLLSATTGQTPVGGTLGVWVIWILFSFIGIVFALIGVLLSDWSE